MSDCPACLGHQWMLWLRVHDICVEHFGPVHREEIPEVRSCYLCNPDGKKPIGKKITQAEIDTKWSTEDLSIGEGSDG